MLLKVDNLNIEFNKTGTSPAKTDSISNENQAAVSGVSFCLNEGEILGIVGESGSGKSLTALAVAGFLNREETKKRLNIKKSGSILFNAGADFNGSDSGMVDMLNDNSQIIRRVQGKHIGIAFQEPLTALNPVQKIGKQVGESLRLHTSLSKTEINKRVIETMQSMGLRDAERLRYKYPHELSGGMRQRAMIASAMICSPRLFIADEVTTALDAKIQSQVIELLKQMNRESRTAILFISHDLRLVKSLCNRAIVMKDGLIVEDGETEDIWNNPQNDYTKELISAIPQFYREDKYNYGK